MEGNNDLKISITYRRLLSIALPISLAILVPQINYITNNIFLGQWSKKSLGEAGITSVYYLIVAVAGNGFNNALQSLISKSAGEGNIEKIHVLVHQAVRIVLQISIAGILITWFFTPYILKPFLSPESYNEEINFLKIRVLGLPFLYLFQLGGAFLIGTFNSRYLMIGFIFQSAVNIFFDFTLIKGRLGFPRLGFNGAAVASVISEVVGLLVVYIVIRRLQLHHRFSLSKKYSFNKVISKEVLNISMPLVLQYVISLTTWLVFFIMIDRGYDADDKAISNVMRNVFGFAGVFIWAFASTTNAVVSNLVGQGRHHEVITAIHKIIRLSFCTALVIGALLNIFPEVFFNLFGQGESFAEKGTPVLRVVAGAMLLMSFAVVWLNSLTGTGQTKINLLVEIFAIVFYLLHTFLVVKVFKVPLFYAWSNEWVYWIVIFIISFIAMNKSKWKNNIS
ncbi:MATE family efflux transporter [Ferruginibacter albus]|uniref:MATE family efflux transporter n=1 Tax=Ferruginibacter albus TaxID=2875540 RepID=UPI001CC75DC5|nr:MATE family efflux transporter [Ferruginibacter albus]UAY50647.1 MATE family efflux transporter [Ferruginibacter albus]